MTDKILSEAKKIMDEFIKALSNVKLKEKFGVERLKQTRTPLTEKCENSDFKKRMLANAPKVKDDYLVMEKKKW